MMVHGDGIRPTRCKESAKRSQLRGVSKGLGAEGMAHGKLV